MFGSTISLYAVAIVVVNVKIFV